MSAKARIKTDKDGVRYFSEELTIRGKRVLMTIYGPPKNLTTFRRIGGAEKL